MTPPRFVLLLAVFGFALWIGGCGGSDSTGTGATTTGVAGSHDSGGGSAPFKVKGGDNSIQEAGHEASGSEFRRAAAALHAYLDARAARDWAVACGNLAPRVTEQFAQLYSDRPGKGAGCPQVLAELSDAVPPSALREAAIADVGSFRVDGDFGFLLFHGARGSDWFVPMAREGGVWKVAALAPSPLQ